MRHHLGLPRVLGRPPEAGPVVVVAGLSGLVEVQRAVGAVDLPALVAAGQPLEVRVGGAEL